MKRILSFALSAALFVFAFTGIGGAAEKIGVVNFDTVWAESKVGKLATEELTKFLEERQAIITDLEMSLDGLGAVLADEDLSADERAEVQVRFDEALAEYTDTVSFFQAELDAFRDDLQTQIFSDVRMVVRRLAEAQGYDLILDASALFYHREVIDLTFEVVRMYDALWEEELAQRAAAEDVDAAEDEE